ncbi:MAG: PEGA domain-containing protein [Planctomycetia bacterium]|nr:PEGA domain-containing protein [Planctomycetia bacterium]
MRKILLLLGFIIITSPCTGCIYRRMTIMSEPPGARVFVNNVEVGTTPCNVPTNVFLDHGNYKFTLFKDGFEPLEVLQPVPANAYEYPAIDFLAEICPIEYRDRRVFNYQLQPVREKSGDELKQQADEFRQRGGGGMSTAPLVVPPPAGQAVSPPPNAETGPSIPLPPR